MRPVLSDFAVPTRIRLWPLMLGLVLALLIPAMAAAQSPHLPRIMVEHAAGAGVGLQPVGHRQLADALDELEGGRALLLADDVAQDATE